MYLFKHVSHLLPSIWSVLLEYLHHFHVAIFYRDFLRCLFLFCFCLWFCCCFDVVFVLFSFVFISGPDFSSTSKNTAVTTAFVELNIKTIIVLLLFTLKIEYYSRKEQFSIQHWSLNYLERRLSKLLSANRTK